MPNKKNPSTKWQARSTALLLVAGVAGVAFWAGAGGNGRLLLGAMAIGLLTLIFGLITEHIIHGSPASEFCTEENPPSPQRPVPSELGESADSERNHLIRTPLTTILGYSELLRDQELEQEARDSYVTIIQRSGKDLLINLEDSLQLPRMEDSLLLSDLGGPTEGAGSTEDSDTPSAEVARPPLADRRVLLAEDNVDNSRLIDFILSKQGATVTTAENGSIALDLAICAINGDSPFDVILMDIEMPVMSGIEATKELRAREYDLPIIALTANATDKDRDQCMAAGCDGFATKPVKKRALVELILQKLVPTNAN